MKVNYFNLNILIFYGFLFVILCSSSFIYAQNCNNYSTNCDLNDRSYLKGSTSQGIKIGNGQIVSVVGMVYEGNENYISFCSEFETGEIHFKILLADTKEVLYDNTEDSNKQSIILRVGLTAKVIIQITAPSAKYSFSESKCVGFLIAYKAFEKVK